VGYGTKFFTYSMQMVKCSDKITWGYRPNKECHYALRNMELYSADKIKNNIFNTQIDTFLLSSLPLAVTVMPNSQTKLR